MLELELTDANGTLENLNTRTEKVGPDKVPAADLKITCPLSADILAFFSPTLKAHLFNTEGPRDLADGMQVRYPHMDYPLGIDEEMTGAELKIAYGVREPMEFTDCKVNQFRLTPMEGGSVILGFRVQCRPDERQIGKLYLLQEQGITVTLEPADLPELSSGNGNGKSPTKDGQPIVPLIHS